MAEIIRALFRSLRARQRIARDTRITTVVSVADAETGEREEVGRGVCPEPGRPPIGAAVRGPWKTREV